MSKRPRTSHSLVHLVIASNYDDAGNTLKAFVDKGDADAFAASCRAYHEKKPECPPVEDTSENDRLWDKWNLADARWRKRHPGGEAAIYRDSFDVISVRLIAPLSTETR